METIRFVHCKDTYPQKQIIEINELTPRIGSRNRFDASTNHCLKEAIEFLAKDYRNSVRIELVKRKE